VLGYVGRPEGRAALERAIDETRLRDGHLVIVHSLRGPDDEDEYLQDREDIEDLEERLAGEGVRFTVREYARGRSAPEELVAVANELDAEIIVIGIRRRSPVGKLIMGSNAQAVLLHAECPVLAVRAPEE
jgi:nucleotide-binding universal stress UspA family protein